MGAPLTIEQLIANHNIGVNLSDAATLGGKKPEEFSLVGHKHSAVEITSGVMHPDRLPTATANGKGIVMLTDSTDSDSSTLAATAYAVKAVKNLANGKADALHKHHPADILTGKFPVILEATSTDALGAKQIRNIILGKIAPSNSVGSDGDIYFQYE